MQNTYQNPIATTIPDSLQDSLENGLTTPLSNNLQLDSHPQSSNSTGGNISNLGHPGGREGSSACQECGNSAKKDCQFHRCRTCCKSRGFPCQTHVKSTWVPAARRRERQAAEAAAAAAGQPLTSRKKRALMSLNDSTISQSSAAIVPLSNETAYIGANVVNNSTSLSSSHLILPQTPTLSELVPVNHLNGKVPLPAEVTAQTLLKSVRVTGVVDGVFEFGYHATVKIGGHIFKGVLYNAGIDPSGGANIHPPSTNLTAPVSVVSAVEEMKNSMVRGENVSNLSHLLDSSSLFGASGVSLLGTEAKHAPHDLFGANHLSTIGL